MADRITVDFGSLKNNDLCQRGRAVAKALDGSTKYSDPPVSASDVQSQADAFHDSIIDAMEGTKTARAKRDSLRAQLISTLKMIVPYVQENCAGDLSDSGFETFTPARKPAQPVTTPKFRWIKRGPVSGSILLMIGAVDGARGYEVECTPIQDGIPGNPTYLNVMNVKSAYTVSGLTRGMMYAFRVRALGVINKSDWSAPITFVCN